MEKQPIYKANKDPKGGVLLLSDPFMKDAYFSRSVVLLAEHNEDGSFGLILNKPIDVKLTQLVENFPEFDVKVYLGGPVKPNNLFYLHSLGDKIENSMKIKEGLYFGGDIERIKDLILLNEIGPNDIKFFVGYAGWTPGQLNNEIKEESWLIVDFKNQNFVDNTPYTLWNNILQKMGSKYYTWSVAPIDPQLN